MTQREYEIEAEDGCIWSIYWFRDAAGFFADVWEWGPDDDVGGTADPAPDCTCPFPVLGVYDTLETVEVAIGRALPGDVRQQLLADARRYPLAEDEQGAWGRVWGAEVYRTDPDGQIHCSFAPTWAEDPCSARWDPDGFPLAN